MAYDANGNVMAIVTAASGVETARYDYDPFGQTLRATGPMALLNSIRFSTQFADDVKRTLHYLFRPLRPSLGRWLCRAPIGKSAFFDDQVAQNPKVVKKLRAEALRPAYTFIANDGLNKTDRLALSDGVYWEGSGSCPSGAYATFAQVAYGGIWPFNDPFVDDGSTMFGTASGCLEYPPDKNGYTGFFDDTPSSWTGELFVTCLLCIKHCCSTIYPPKGGTPFNVVGNKIVKIGPCKKWNAGDSGDLSAFQDATQSEIQIWTSTISAQYPNWQDCYHCDSSPRL
jgi:YD repeat-containing protein